VIDKNTYEKVPIVIDANKENHNSLDDRGNHVFLRSVVSDDEYLQCMATYNPTTRSINLDIKGIDCKFCQSLAVNLAHGGLLLRKLAEAVNDYLRDLPPPPKPFTKGER